MTLWDSRCESLNDSRQDFYRRCFLRVELVLGVTLEQFKEEVESTVTILRKCAVELDKVKT